MAQQDEPLYDFPEPTQTSKRKLLAHQRGRGSLRSISVLDRLLLTVPVWLQLSINPATALHILQREPPGTFLVRRSRTSQTNVLCVRLADDSVPSFVQQFGIREEQCTLSLETSAISFPDLPRLISFYCVSRDVLPFPLELPEAIAKATSHKELESISHMGIEFWNSHLNVRGPREPPKLEKEEKKPDSVPSASPAPPPSPPPPPPPPLPSQTSSESTSQPDSDKLLMTTPESDNTTTNAQSAATLFDEFCPIRTRSPRELDYGSGLGALCFINPLFLQSQNVLCRRRMFKRSLKIRVSTETSTLLSPPLAPPPPPPIMPKTKGRCKAQKQGKGAGVLGEDPNRSTAPPPSAPHLQPLLQEQGHTGAPLPTVVENLPKDDYMQPPPMVSLSSPLSLSPYHSPSVAPPLFPKLSLPAPAHGSPGASPSLSPYQSPSISPRVPFSLSPYDSPGSSPYQSPSPSPKLPFSLSPFTSSPLSQMAEQAYHTPATTAGPDLQKPESDAEDGEINEELHEEEAEDLVLQMNAASLNDSDSCSSFSSLEGDAETPPHSLHDQNLQ